jgi:hypothetical protein
VRGVRLGLAGAAEFALERDDALDTKEGQQLERVVLVRFGFFVALLLI